MNVPYKIKDWETLYENSASRKLVHMTWVPVPNKHDGAGYTTIMRTPDDKPRPDAAKIFSAWNLMLQVASKCNPRGTLINKDGQPIDPAELSLKTRAPKDWFDLAIPLLLEIGWIVGESPALAAGCPGVVGRKGMEQKGTEGKGTEGNMACAIPSHLLEIWKDFEELRKKKRQPLTNRAIKNILSILSKHPHDVQIKMIDQSITCGYTGIFELKESYKDKPQKSNLSIKGINYQEGLE